MSTAKIFQSGNSQAVRLPRQFRFDTDEVCIRQVGEMLILYPKNAGLDLLQGSLNEFTPDFMENRDQPGQADMRNWT